MNCAPQYEEKCKIDPATVASFLGAANVKREPGSYDQEGNGQGGPQYGGDDGPWPPAEGLGEQDIRQYMQVSGQPNVISVRFRPKISAEYSAETVSVLISYFGISAEMLCFG